MSDYSILASIDADDSTFQQAFARADATAAKVEAKIAASMAKIDKATSAAFRSAETESRKLQLALERTFSPEGAEKARKAAAAALEVAKANRDGAMAALGGARAADQATGSYDRQRKALDMLTQANRAYKAAQESVAAADQRGAQIEAAARIERETVALQKAAQAQREYNQLLGVGPAGGSGAQRGEDIEAYGRSLDALRASLVPAFATQQEFKRRLDETLEALRVGAISHDEYREAVQRAHQETVGAAEAEREHAIALARAEQAADTAQRSFNELLGVRERSAGVARASAAVFEQAALDEARAIEQAAQAQAEYNRILGVSAQTDAERAAASEEYAAALEQIRAKYVPLEVAQEAYEAELREINALHQAGALTTDQYNAALSRAKSELDGANRVHSAGATGASRYGAAIQSAGYQVGDFAVQVASGSGVLRPFIQQGTQLISGFGVWGAVIGAAGAVVGALATSIMSASAAQEEFGEKTKVSAAELDNYEKALERSRKASLDAENNITGIMDARQKKAVEGVEEELKNNKALQDDLAARIKFQQALIASQRNEQGAPRLGVSAEEIKDAADALVDLTEKADKAAEEADTLNNRLVTLGATAGDTAEMLRFKDTLKDIALQIEQQNALTGAIRKGGRAVAEVNDLFSAYGDIASAGLGRADPEAIKLIDLYQRLGRVLRENAAIQTETDLGRSILQQKLLTFAASEGAEAFAKAKDRQEAYQTVVRLGIDLNSERADTIQRIVMQLSAEERVTKAIQQAADIKDEISFQKELGEAYGQGAAAVAALTQKRKADLAVQALAIPANSEEAKTIRDRINALEDEQRTTAVKERIKNLSDEILFQRDLANAYGEGELAVARLNTERKIQLELQQRGLDLTSEEGRSIAALIRQLDEQARKTKLVEDSWKILSDAIEQGVDRIGEGVTQMALEGENAADNIRNIGRAIYSELLQLSIRLAAINPFKNWVFGQSNPTLGSVLSAVGAPAGSQAGGSAFGGMNPLSFANTGGLYNQFAFSGLGQSLGLSTAYGGLGAVAGVSSATPAATLALSGPAGGMGTVAGLSTASTGGTAAAAGLGGATAPALTGLGAAMPYIGIALAGLALFSGIFSGQPSVGPVGVADFSPGLGRRNAFDVDGIDPFTADNGGNGESLRPIAEAIADLIADSADRFSATIDESLRFRVANYQGPEKGSGRASGFEVNAFINQEAEKRVAEGLTQEQAVFEAFRFAIQEAFTFDSATIAEAAANTAATTTEEILADLDFAKNFEALGQALENLGGTVDANTLALAQQTLAIQKQAEDFATANAQPILDAFEKARELFPATRSGEESRRVTERGVFVNEGEGKRDRRFVEEGTDEFDRLTSGSDPLRVVTRIRTVTEEVDTQAENYAANMERMRQATEIANASVELLVDQVTGEFEPAVRGPFQTALEQGQANLEELATYFDDLNEQITDANEAFPGLNAALIDTNTVITDAMAALREQLQQDFTDSIQRQMNAAQGLGGINVINDLIDTRSQNATDAASLGLDVNSTAGALFDAQLRQALEGSSLADLGALLSSGQIVDEGARAIVEAVLAEEALAAIRVEEVAGMQELYAATEQFASAAKNNARTLRQAADALLVDPNLSPLSPELRLQEARRQFEEAFGLANDDDPTDELSQDAIQRLPGLSQTMLEASRAYYGSTEGYLADFNRAQDVLNNTALRQESVEQQQLDALRDIEAAIAAAGGSVVGRTPAEQAASSGFNFGGESERNQRIYNALVAAGLPTPEGFGGSVSGNLGQLRAANPAVDALVTAMGFATGGSFTVAGPAGNDNLLMPLRLTAGEAVNVSRGDSMAAMSQRLESLVSLQAESNQINKALLHENAQQARSLSRANAENAKLNRLLTDRQAAQPRVAYR